METIIVNLNNVQKTLVSGTNIKTINGTSLLGSGNIIINSDNIYTANGTITDAERVVSLIGDGLTDKLIVANDTGIEFFQLTGAKTAYLGDYDSAPTATSRLVVGTLGMTNGINIVGTGTNGITIANTGVYGLITSQKYGVTSTSSTANGYGVKGVVSGGTGTNIGLIGEAITVNTGDNIALQLSSSGANGDNLSIEITAGDIKFSQATQNMTLNGDTSADTMVIQTAGGSDIATFYGDQTTRFNGEIGLGTSPNSINTITVTSTGYTSGIRVQGSGTYGLNINGSMSTGGLFQSSAGGGKGGIFKATGTSGVCIGGNFTAIGVGATTNVGGDFTASGATKNYAIRINGGDFKTPSGTGQTGTYTFGGGGSGDIASMQFEKGILIARTLVP